MSFRILSNLLSMGCGMKNCIWLSLAFVVVVGFSATEVLARGGARHPEPRGGGERPEGEGRQGGERSPSERGETHASGQNRPQGSAANRGNTVQNRTSQ